MTYRGGRSIPCDSNGVPLPATATRLEVASSTITYVGKATAGTATSTAIWQIQRLTSTAGGNLTIEYADGNILYDNVWDNRASLSYS